MENLDSFLLGEDEAKIINQIAITYQKREIADRRLKFTANSSGMCRAILPAVKSVR